MDKILVTGGTGFVGEWMRRTQPAEIGECRYIGKNTYQNMNSLVRQDWSAIVHLAQADPSALLVYALKNKARFLYCSSGIVYHPEWDTIYRKEKLDGEKITLESGADVVIARLFTFFGDGLDEHKAISKFTQAAKNNQPIHVTGGGKTIRSYMHGEDLGKWVWAILLHGKSGEAYDVGDDNPINMFDLARLVKDTCNSSSDIVVSDEPDPMPHYLPPNTAKTKALLTI